MIVYAWLIDFAHSWENCPTGKIPEQRLHPVLDNHPQPSSFLDGREKPPHRWTGRRQLHPFRGEPLIHPRINIKESDENIGCGGGCQGNGPVTVDAIMADGVDGFGTLGGTEVANSAVEDSVIQGQAEEVPLNQAHQESSAAGGADRQFCPDGAGGETPDTDCGTAADSAIKIIFSKKKILPAKKHLYSQNFPCSPPPPWNYFSKMVIHN